VLEASASHTTSALTTTLQPGREEPTTEV
jgi:hypothetical protein